MLIDEAVLSERIEASRNKVIQIEKGKELAFSERLAFKNGQDYQSMNNTLSIHVKQKLYLHVYLENHR